MQDAFKLRDKSAEITSVMQNPLWRRTMDMLGRTCKHGFTLVELALLLVIAGLLVSSALKAEALFQNAKAKRLIEQKESLYAAYYTFYDRHGVYPGDENRQSFPGNDTHDGDCNGKVTGDERYYLFEDLVLAGIMSGDYAGITGSEPVNIFGGSMYILWQTVNGTQDHWATFLQIPSEAAELIDRTYDDGVYYSGSVRVSSAYSDTTNKILFWRM